MWLFHKNISDIVEDDIRQLMAEQTVESVHLDFKQMPPGTSDAEKEEFRLDVCSFANGSGGLIIYGAAESGGGFATSLAGIPNAEVEGVTNRMTQVLRSGIEPNLIGAKLHPIKLSNGTSLIALKVLRSFNMPHRVVKSRRFVIRHGAGKIDMSIEEIRSAFLYSSNHTERINSWINERIDEILEYYSGDRIQVGQRIILFVIPLSSLYEGNNLDVKSIAKQANLLQPIASSSNPGRYVLEGYITRRGTFGEYSDEVDYAKTFRNARIEAVDASYIGKSHKLATVGFERTILETVARYLSALKALSITPPIYIKLLLTGVKDYCFNITEHDDWFFDQTGKEISQMKVPLPAVWINEWGDCDDLPDLLKQTFDALWNSCGWPGSPNYSNGVYKPMRTWISIN